ncbi:MAG: ATP synthase subunit I [Isosphaerales bacterium]
MSWVVAVSAGAGLGFAYFGGLWLTVRNLVRRPERAALVPLSGLVRLVMLGLGLVLVGRQGAGNLIAALAGLWMARSYLLRRLGGTRNGE